MPLRAGDKSDLFLLPIYSSLSRVAADSAESGMSSPKTECFMSRWLQEAKVMKNWDLLVFGPLFAMEKIPRFECYSLLWNSSRNVPFGPVSEESK